MVIGNRKKRTGTTTGLVWCTPKVLSRASCVDLPKTNLGECWSSTSTTLICGRFWTSLPTDGNKHDLRGAMHVTSRPPRYLSIYYPTMKLSHGHDSANTKYARGSLLPLSSSSVRRCVSQRLLAGPAGRYYCTTLQVPVTVSQSEDSLDTLF